MKRLLLLITRFIHNFSQKLPVIASYLCPTISVVLFLIILFPRCFFNKLPVLSYYIKEKKLPVTYSLTGSVKVLNKNGEVVGNNIEIFVGGYSVFLKSEQFDLTFSSPIVNKVYVVITYEVDQELHRYTEILEFNNSVNVITKDFIIYV